MSRLALVIVAVLAACAPTLEHPRLRGTECGAEGERCCTADGGGTTCFTGLGCAPSRDADGGLTTTCQRCGVNQRVCDGRCVNVASDARNCGACGVVCAAGESCVAARGELDAGAAACRSLCSAGATWCAGSCVNVASDMRNCGACGTTCGGGQSCVAGRCACPAGQTLCGTSCVDTSSTNMHCGACGNACMAGTTCRSGACTCPVASNTPCAASGCVNLQNDSRNCGTCGTVCANGPCSNGVCPPCTSGLTLCAGIGCTNLSSDTASCGACGRVCDTGMLCRSGSCQCPTLLTACTGSGCVNTATDTRNCGACGRNCESMLPNATVACSGARCTMSACRSGYADCNPSAGCETDVRTDPNQCGGCNRRCRVPNATPNCVGGTCGIASCNAGFADCDGNAANGCEVNLLADVSNCGACARVCMSPSMGSAVCLAGSCDVGATCEMGRADCNGMASDACEVDLRIDARNCGRCGLACNATDGTPTCTMGMCASIACTSGSADCDRNLGNGCEVTLSSDPLNCGACGRVCPNLRCVGGTCM